MTKLTPRKAELLARIERSPPMSIYQLARACDRNYRRVFDHVKDLAAAGLVNIRSTVRNGRQVSMVESIYHQRLQRLDDLYAFQVLPASETGISPGVFEIRAGLRVADIKSFITSKCIAAGQQDMHDVAAICMIYPEHCDYCRNSASEHDCLDKLESWLSDRRLQQRYQPKTD